jgi:hypothetical protein
MSDTHEAIALLQKWYNHAKSNPRLHKTAGKDGERWMPLVLDTEAMLANLMPAED